MKKIIIQKVKNIEFLEFEIPDKGVYLLTGKNGSGKTTLLASLHRIGYKNSFADYFKTTSSEEKLDFFGDSSITYILDEERDEKVVYKYGNARWSPSPRKNSHLLSNFGYPRVKFVAANAKRIEPTSHELKTIRMKNADNIIIKDLKKILSDNRFEGLKYINTKTGPGNKAYLIQKKINNKSYYFSEKNFSLGEFCVLKLVTELNDLAHNSLVLIDEIEMALHPKAQVKLFTYIEEIAKAKDLTIIFSTHSASLIKRTPRKQIFVLENNGDGVIGCLRNCFPARVLGDITYDDEVEPDFLFFVEDLKAQYILEQMVDQFKQDYSADKIFPYYKVIPVGGYDQVIDFLINSDQIFKTMVKRYAFLDKDGEDEVLKKAEEQKRYGFLEKVKINRDKIKYLPCVPEQGIIKYCEDESSHYLAKVLVVQKTHGSLSMRM
jgi:predicted ATPase